MWRNLIFIITKKGFQNQLGLKTVLKNITVS